MLKRKTLFAALVFAALLCHGLTNRLTAQALPDLTEELRVARQTLSSPQIQRAFEYVEGSGEVFYPASGCELRNAERTCSGGDRQR